MDDQVEDPGEAQAYAGIWPMLYSLFREDGGLSEAAVARQIEAAVATGAAGVSILGLAAETNKLSTAERSMILGWTAKHAGAPCPFAVTIAEANVQDQIDFARSARDQGAAWVILQPPPAALTGVDQTTLAGFFRSVAEAVELPVAIQNAPGLMAASLAPETLRTLHEACPNLRILKAEGPAVYIDQLNRATAGAFHLLNGLNGMDAIESYRAGCVGLIPSPDTMDAHVAIHRDFVGGDEPAAQERFRRLLPLVSFLMAGIPHLLCYGKRLSAQRLGLGEVHDRQPALAPTAFGLEALARLAAAAGLGRLD